MRSRLHIARHICGFLQIVHRCGDSLPRLQMTHSAFSLDGTSWSQLSDSTFLAGSQLGLVVASGTPEVATAVSFEIETT
jgi:hypothetical protein